MSIPVKASKIQLSSESGAQEMNQREFEASLEKGQEVRLRWRGNSCRAIVVRVNKASITVTTREALDGIPVGTRFKVNRVSSNRWSSSNSVRPVDQ